MLFPNAKQLIQELTEKLRPKVAKATAMVGIHSGGAWVAEMLHKQLDATIPLGHLDISFYRDDFSKIGLHPVVKPSHIPFEVEGANIILIDDVLYTGRTIRAAMNNLFDYGRPASITLAVLIDRGGREVPVCAEYVGTYLKLPTNQNIELNRLANGTLELNVKAAE